MDTEKTGHKNSILISGKNYYQTRNRRELAKPAKGHL